MLFFYRKGKNATQTRYVVYGKGAVAERTAEVLDLKLIISTLKIRNARVGPPPQMKIRLKY